MVNYVVNYFYTGNGNGALSNLIQGTFDDPLGSGEQIAQDQESGRDQGHAQMSAMVAANLAQMAYTLFTKNPSVTKLDFFSANNNALPCWCLAFFSPTPCVLFWLVSRLALGWSVGLRPPISRGCGPTSGTASRRAPLNPTKTPTFASAKSG